MKTERARWVWTVWSAVASLLLVQAAVGVGAGQVANEALKLNRPAVPAAQFRIGGVVVNGLTGDPVVRCRLTATRAEANRQARQPGVGADDNSPVAAETDAQGRFQLSLPSAGAWRLVGTARGFRAQAYDEHQGFSSSIVLNEAAPSVDLTFKLLPNALVDGFVLDEAGEAVRNAQLSLVAIPPVEPDGRRPARQPRGNATTDDRGHYEFSNIAPGEYLISVRAQPWYATAVRRGPMPGGVAPDPSMTALDVVYPTTWYPGVTDFSAATPMTLQAGDRRQADFRLLPVPGYHLRIPAPGDDGSERIGAQPIASIAELSPDGSQHMVPMMVTRSNQGEWDISGLAPGSYEVHTQNGPAEVGRTSLLEIGSQGPRTVDLGAAAPMARVSLTIDGAGDTDKVQVNLIDAATRRSNIVPSVRSDQGAQSQGGGGVKRVTEVPPGRYEVVLNNTGRLHLAGITATGAEVTGRTVTLLAGSVSLALHVADGRGSVSGVARLNGAPMEGAMVLLVPATLGDPAALAALRRDQSNTDGSFRIDQVLPGTYILLAIDHGWSINWSDPSTLSHYLMHGVAVDLSRPAGVKTDLVAQAP